MSVRVIRSVATAIVVAAGTACSGGGDGEPSQPPLGFGVTDEEHLVQLLMGHSMAPKHAECVARHAFAAGPSNEHYADGSYEITQAMLADAGVGCEIDWSDYIFTGD